MATLTAHLLETGDHGRLGFHPDCSVCRRERLFGALSSEAVVSRRAQAALASGVLALSAAAPATAFAQERDRQHEGGAAPDQSGAGESDSPAFNPGGDTALPFEVVPTPAPTGESGGTEADDSAPLESEPVDDPDARLVPPSSSELPVPQAEGETAISPAEGLPPAEGVASPETPAPQAPTPDIVQPPPVGVETPITDRQGSRESSPSNERSERKRTTVRANEQEAAKPTTPAVVGPTTGVGDTSSPVLDAEATATDQPIAQGDSSGRPLEDGARFYVVEAGDSLWSIAKRLLGPDASPGRIAREVSRLWTLNEDRIGTGDPDLLMAGTRLRLR